MSNTCSPRRRVTETLTVELPGDDEWSRLAGPELDAEIRAVEVAARRIEAAMVPAAGECDRRPHHPPDGTVLCPADAA
jgi:hypothetical protein